MHSGRIPFIARLAAAGRAIFGKRLFIGLAVALVGIELLEPKPLFAREHLLVQLGGLVLIAAGIALRAWGAGSAGSHTRSGVLAAPRLVTGGPFAYVRNPIYLGSIGLGLGMATLIGDPLAFLLASLAFAALYFTIVPAEEEFLRTRFGVAYEHYRRAVPRLIPRLSPWPNRHRESFQWCAARGEIRILLLLVAIYGALLLEEHFDRLGWS